MAKTDGCDMKTLKKIEVKSDKIPKYKTIISYYVLLVWIECTSSPSWYYLEVTKTCFQIHSFRG